MAKLSYTDAMNEYASANTNNGNNNNVGFLSLKNDGDEAIVRFMLDSVDDFDIYMVHAVTLDGKNREANCIRTPQEPLDNCPLCQSGSPVKQKFFIKMIQYVQEADGKITPQAKLWERTISYAKTMKSYLDNYGPLSDIICKIIRHGKAGDKQTTYEIVPNLSKTVYRDDVFVKVPDIFGDYEPLGRVLLDKNAEEMITYLNTGSFPARVNNNQAPIPQEAPAYTPSQPMPTPETHNSQLATQPVPAATPMTAPTNFGAATEAIPANPNRGSMPWETSGAPFNRPRRY